MKTPITVRKLLARLSTMPLNAPVCGTWEGICVILDEDGVTLSRDGVVVLVVDQDDRSAHHLADVNVLPNMRN